MPSHSSKSVIYAALAGNAAIAVTKFIAAVFTGSAAMMSEAIHSVVDTGNQILLLFGLRRAAKPANAKHPFGHGLQLYFYTFVVAVLVFGLGATVSIWHGVEKIMHPQAIQDVWVNYLVLGIGIAFEGAVWLVAFRAFNAERGESGIIESIRNSKDPTIFTVLFEDTAALLGLFMALIGIALSQWLNMPMLDGVASVLIGMILTATALFLAYESQSLLTGESADKETRDGILRIALAEPGIDRINQSMTMHFGPHDVLVALSLDFRDSLSAADVEHTVTRMEQKIKAAYPHVTRIFIEAQSFEAHLRAANPA